METINQMLINKLHDVYGYTNADKLLRNFTMREAFNKQREFFIKAYKIGDPEKVEKVVNEVAADFAIAFESKTASKTASNSDYIESIEIFVYEAEKSVPSEQEPIEIAIFRAMSLD